MSDREEWTAEVLGDAYAALSKDKPILAANLAGIADRLIEAARLEDGCLHYDYPARKKMRGELVCGGCSTIFGYWREPPIQVTVTRTEW